MSTIRVVNVQHTDATEPNIVLLADGTSVFASGITISGGTNLTVSGTAEFASGTVSAPGVTFIDDNNTGLYSPAADTVAITTAATERLRVDSSGKVGIGNTSASSFDSEANNLVVGDGTGDNGITIYTGTAAGNHGSIFFADGTGSSGAKKKGQIRYEQNNEVMSFHTNEQERLRIDLSGNVGIGSSDPTGDGWSIANDLVISGTGHSGMTIKSGTSSYGQLVFNDAAGGLRGSVFYEHSNDALGFTANASEQMRITSDGTLVIGRTASSDPNRYVQIHNGSAASSAYLQSTNTGTGSGAADGIVMGMGDATNAYFWNYEAGATVFATNAGEKMRITSLGKVGIGYSSPPAALSVHATGTDSTAGFFNSGVANVFLQLGNSANNQGYLGYESSVMTFYTAGTEKMRIDSSGNLSVGPYDTSPYLAGAKLFADNSGGATLVLNGNGSTGTGLGVYDGNATAYTAKIIRNGSAQFMNATDSAYTFISHKPAATAFCISGGDSNNTGAPKFYITTAGAAVFTGSVTASNVSDVRFKENITDARPQLADAVALGSQLKNFDWSDDAPLNDEQRAKRFLGLVAQEAEKVCPGLTYTVPRTKQGKELTPETTDEEGNVTPPTYEQLDDSYKAINHDILVMKLLGAVAELSAKVAALEAG